MPTPDHSNHGDFPGDIQSDNLRLLKGWLRHARPPGRDGLMGFVLDAVGNLEWPEARRRQGYENSHSHSVNLLMILEVYCYARGVYESTEVELLAYQNPELGILFQDEPPTANVIRDFRRQHRRLIKQALQEVFDLALLVRFGAPETEEAPIDDCVVQAMDQWFEPICGPHPDWEAEERLEKASFWDGMADAC